MDRSERYRAASDIELVEAVRRADENAWEEFVRRTESVVYAAVEKFFPEPETEEEFVEIYALLRGGGDSHLAPFDGAAKLETFLKVAVDKLLGLRVIALFEEDHRRAWMAIQRRYESLVKSTIWKAFHLAPGQSLPDGLGTPEDLLSDFWSAKMPAIQTYRANGAFSAFVAVMVQNWCADLRDKVQRRQFTPISAPNEEGKSLEGRLQAPDPPPDRAAFLGEIRRAVDRLPDDDERLVMLLFLEGMDAADIARARQATTNTVNRTIERAKAHLKSMLREI